MVSEQPPTPQALWLWYGPCSFDPGLVVFLFIPPDKTLLTPRNSVLALIKLGVGPGSHVEKTTSILGGLKLKVRIRTCPRLVPEPAFPEGHLLGESGISAHHLSKAKRGREN